MGKISTSPTIAGRHHTTHEPGGEDVVFGIAPGAHAAVHILAGADPIIGALDARAIALTAQGEIVYHAAAANTLAVLAVGGAGQALLTGGPAANPSWGAPAPAAHESTHVQGGADDIDSALDARALGLANQGDITFRAAAANTLATLGPGAAGTALLSGGVGADLSWGAPTPAAHVLATTGPHTGELPLTDLTAGARGEIITRTVADWAALAVGAAGQALLSGGAGADVSWGAPSPAAHESTHILGGSDDIDGGLDARALNFANQGEIVFRDAVANTLAVLAPGVAGQALLTGGAAADPSWGAPAPAAHAASHKDGGTDELDVSELAGAIGGAGEIPETDGAAVTWVDPDSRYDPKAHVLATTGPHSAPLPLIDLEVGVQGEVIHRGAADWEALAVGAVGEVLISGGPGADVSWALGPAPGAHEATHVQGGADDIDSALDARALGLVNQGDITFRAAAANTLATLGPGAAGTALLSGGVGADLSWGAPAPAAHAASHKDGGTDELDVSELAGALGSAGEIPESDGAAVSWVDPDGRYDPKAHVLDTTGPHTGTLLLTDLEVGARGEIITRTVADWAALGVGAAGHALLSGGVGADVSWGSPAPAAHESSHILGGSDDIDSGLDARAIALTEHGSIVYHAAGANTLAELLHGSAGQALLTYGHGAGLGWGSPAPAAHESSHISGGSDDIDSALDGRAITLTTQGDLVYASGVNTLARLAAGTAGQTLQTGGAGANPSWTWSKQLNPDPVLTDTGNGIFAPDIVGENVIAGDVLYMKADGKYWKADADGVATMPAKVMVMAAGAADATVNLLHIGYYRENSRWNWTVGDGQANLLYVHTTAGDITQFATKPGSGKQLQIVGYVVTADIIFFNPSYNLEAVP